MFPAEILFFLVRASTYFTGMVALNFPALHRLEQTWISDFYLRCIMVLRYLRGTLNYFENNNGWADTVRKIDSLPARLRMLDSLVLVCSFLFFFEVWDRFKQYLMFLSHFAFFVW